MCTTCQRSDVLSISTAALEGASPLPLAAGERRYRLPSVSAARCRSVRGICCRLKYLPIEEQPLPGGTECDETERPAAVG
jgi:hypothetical protein